MEQKTNDRPLRDELRDIRARCAKMPILDHRAPEEILGYDDLGLPGRRNERMRSVRSKSRLYAWWYFAIALGFLLLAINRMLFGEKAWLIILRIVIAAGFAILGYMELRARSRTK